MRRARLDKCLHDLRSRRVVGGAHTQVRPNHEMLERLALGVEMSA